MAENHTRKNYSNVEAVDILHQVANLYISTKIPRTTEPERSTLRLKYIH